MDAVLRRLRAVKPDANIMMEYTRMDRFFTLDGCRAV